MNIINRFMQDESGEFAVEWVLMAALMAVAIIAAMGTLTPKLSTAFTRVGASLTDAIPMNTR